MPDYSYTALASTGWMAANVDGFRGPLEAERFAGGKSNPTFRLRTPGAHYVLRRKPMGALLKSAHAVDREFRVMSALHGIGFPVPRMRALCLDDAVLGSAFYVMDHVEGRLFWDPTLPDLPAPERAQIYDSMNDTIARLHQVDYAAIGLADDLWSGPERGFRAHLRAGRTTGVLKLLGIPLYALVRTRSVSGALLVGLSANALNQLDTKPGRALKAYVAAAVALHAPLGTAVLLAPYDLREMAMLGDAGANALGALLGLRSVSRLTGKSRWMAIGALAGLNLLVEHRSLGDLIGRTPGLRELDRWGRPA